MTELRFKLKKDGKCVGYERHKLTAHGSMMLQHRKPDRDWKVLLCGANSYTGWIAHDEKCSFVCTDCNGKDVYEGDHVVTIAEQECGIVVMFEQWHCWCVKSRIGYKSIWQCIGEKGIELLPDEVQP